MNTASTITPIFFIQLVFSSMLYMSEDVMVCLELPYIFGQNCYFIYFFHPRSPLIERERLRLISSVWESNLVANGGFN